MCGAMDNRKIPPKWSLDQALIWIVTRDLEKVFAGDPWAIFILNLYDEFGEGHGQGDQILSPGKMNGCLAASPNEAEALLRHALQDGSVVAEGTQTGPVSAHWFNAVELKLGADGVKAFNPTDPWVEPNAIARPYDDRARILYVLSAGLMKAFPVIDTQQPHASVSTDASEPAPRVHTKGEVEAAYRDWIARHDGQTPPSRDADEEHMRSKFPGLSRPRLRELRSSLAPSAWKKAGPKGSGK
jgi:hypothetical protein